MSHPQEDEQELDVGNICNNIHDGSQRPFVKKILQEQLGAPILLYRHAPSYTMGDVVERWGRAARSQQQAHGDAMYLSQSWQASLRARVRWCSDLPYQHGRHWEQAFAKRLRNEEKAKRMEKRRLREERIASEEAERANGTWFSRGEQIYRNRIAQEQAQNHLKTQNQQTTTSNNQLVSAITTGTRQDTTTQNNQPLVEHPNTHAETGPIISHHQQEQEQTHESKVTTTTNATEQVPKQDAYNETTTYYRPIRRHIPNKEDSGDDTDSIVSSSSGSAQEHRSQFHKKRRILYDVSPYMVINEVVEKRKTRKGSKGKWTAPNRACRLSAVRRYASKQYAKNRLESSNSDYLAPFDLGSIRYCVGGLDNDAYHSKEAGMKSSEPPTTAPSNATDTSEAFGVASSDTVKSTTNAEWKEKEQIWNDILQKLPEREKVPPVNDPCMYGNTLVCFLCTCIHCQTLEKTSKKPNGSTDNVDGVGAQSSSSASKALNISYDRSAESNTPDNTRSNPELEAHASNNEPNHQTRQKMDQVETKLRCKGVCLLHPTGDTLSHVSVSNILLPNAMGNSAPSDTDYELPISDGKRLGREIKLNELDVGGRILQIVSLGNDATQLGDSSTLSIPHYFVARTPTHCTIVSCEALSTSRARLKTRSKASDQDKKSNDDKNCTGLYCISEKARIKLNNDMEASTVATTYIPQHVACRTSSSSNWFTDPTCAVLSHSMEAQNIIHHVTVRDDTIVKKHQISSLKLISQIEFTHSHPLMLWASAESYVRPSLVTGHTKTRPVFGRGSSLYTIDLRSNTAMFQWSPSHEERMTEGMHSISGIMPDSFRDNFVWVTSVSAGKTWEIDARMPCKVVNSWSLPSGCNDWGSTSTKSGIFGSGSILNQPLLGKDSSDPLLSCPLLTVERKDCSYGLNLYQRPLNPPRFQTRSLECAICPDSVSYPNAVKSSICRSSSWPLAEPPINNFWCGLASLRIPLSGLLNQGDIKRLGYAHQPENALMVFTSTKKGDMYAQILAECNASEQRRGQNFPDIPVGSTLLPVKESTFEDSSENGILGRNHSKPDGGWNLPLGLSNTYPCPSDSILSQPVLSRQDCRPFDQIPLDHIPSYNFEKERHNLDPAQSQIPNHAYDHHHDESAQTRTVCVGQESAVSKEKNQNLSCLHHPTTDAGVGARLSSECHEYLKGQDTEKGENPISLTLSSQHTSIQCSIMDKVPSTIKSEEISGAESDTEYESNAISGQKFRSDLSRSKIQELKMLWTNND